MNTHPTQRLSKRLMQRLVFGLGLVCGLGLSWQAQANLIFGGSNKKIWTDTPDWQGSSHAVNISTKTAGQIELDGQSGKRTYSTPYIYIPNSASNTLVQIDTNTGAKRWLISLDSVAVDGDPSRTTVDADGNVWVGLRNSEKVALVRKDGRILKVISVGLVPRAITVDLAGHIWVGSWESNQVIQIQGGTGTIRQRLTIPCPYGATTDIHGNIWVVSRCTTLEGITKISPDGKVLGVYPAKYVYGIATDALGQVWVANYTQGCVYRFTNGGRELGCIPLGYNCLNARGVAVDGNQNIWVSCSNTPLVVKLDSNGKVLAGITTVDEESIGLAIDANGFLWAISISQNRATKININNHRVMGKYTTHGKSPYTYSDMTGFQLQTVAQRSEGVWRSTFSTPCVSSWKSLQWTAQVPYGTQLEIRARSATSRAGLANATWTQPLQNGARPNVPDNPWIEVEARLSSFNAKLTPVLSHLVLSYAAAGTETCNGQDDDCDGIIDNIPGTPNPMVITCSNTCGRGLSPCRNGQWIGCTAPTPLPEVCDGKDNNCDGKIDNDATCSDGYSCVEGACGKPCETKCDEGLRCQNINGTSICVGQKSCKEMATSCQPEQVCRHGQCVAPCAQINCPQGHFCDKGLCYPDNCEHPSRACPTGELCLQSKCQPDPCAGVKCKADEACKRGRCLPSCANIDCKASQSCRDGACISDNCADVQCASGAVCQRGNCVSDPCRYLTCKQGQACLDGRCISDPCLTIRCPQHQICRPPHGICANLPPGQSPSREFHNDIEAVQWWPPAFEQTQEVIAETKGSPDAGFVFPEASQNNPPPNQPEPPGCGCQGTPTPTSLGLLFLICALCWRRTDRTCKGG